MSSPEDEPAITININGARFEATPANTTLFRFFGGLAVYNHVFICTDETATTGTYVFNQNPTYEVFETYMTENQYPLYDNLRAVPECDRNAFEQMINLYTAQIPDEVPTDWL